MIKMKGIYKWRLIDVKTGTVELEGEQENLITDAISVNATSYYGNSKSATNGKIILSKQTVPLPVAEYREYNAAAGAISRDFVSPSLTWVYDDPAGIRKASYNFSPPVSSQTITIFGLDLKTYEFASFTILTTPITQLTTQFLFVEYSLTFQYVGGLLEAPVNAFVSAALNIDIYARLVYLAYRDARSDGLVYATTLRPPVTLNNVGRKVAVSDRLSLLTAPNDGCRYGQNPTKSYISTDIPGPIGCPVWMFSETSSPYENATLGTFATNVTPSVSRVYIHSEAYKEQIFSDPSHPPESRGAITITGTPTCKQSIIMRAKVTKTGDASDIVDETFTANPATDELTVSHDDWAVDDIVQFTTTGTLPSPLALSTDYYVVTKTGSSPTVLIEVSTSQGGGVVNITDAGSGTHTIARQNTGRYRLTMEANVVSLVSNENFGVSGYGNFLALTDPTGAAVSNNYLNTELPAMIGREGSYIYSVQYDATQLQLMICRHEINTVESSVSLHSLFGTSGLDLWCAVRGKGTYSDIVYIATSEGVYKYDFSSPATPTLMPITGMLSIAVQDLSFDEITEYLWAGHEIGMSRIDLSTNIAVPYGNGGGEPLAGMTDLEARCYPGTLTAHNSYVFNARFRSSYVWLYQDSSPVGYFFQSVGTLVGGTINKSDGTVVVRIRSGDLFATYTVSGITGPDTGSWSQDEGYDTDIAADSVYNLGQMYQVDNTTFLMGIRSSFSSLRYFELYKVGIGVIVSSSISPNSVIELRDINGSVPNRMTANTRIGIDVSEGGMDLNILNQGIALMGYQGIQEYGWTGSAWVRGNVNDRQITKTGVDSLSHGVSGQFNNAVGEDWDKQFVLNEYFTFMISPVLIKDNLQEYTLKVRAYHCAVKQVTAAMNETHVVPPGLTVIIDKAPTGASPDADYRDLDTLDWTLEIYNVTSATTMTQVASSPGDEEYSVVGLLDGTFTFNVNQQGDTIRFAYNYTTYF